MLNEIDMEAARRILPNYGRRFLTELWSEVFPKNQYLFVLGSVWYGGGGLNMAIKLSFANEHTFFLFKRIKLFKGSLLHNGLTHEFTTATALPNEA